MMKTNLVLSLALATALPLLAVPRPKPAPKEGPAVPKEADQAGVQNPELGDPKKRGTGFLGVSAAVVPAAQAKQLGIQNGVNLTTVVPGSPAAKAGFEVGDIITEVGDKKIASMLDLSDAIKANREGDKVALKVIRKGKEMNKRVTLAARPEPPRALQARGFFVPGGFRGGLQFDFAGGGGRFRMGDEEGTVEMKGEGEGAEVIVRDHDNEIVFEGPWVTPQDKAAAPPDIKKRVERIAGTFGRFGPGVWERFKPAEIAPPPAPIPGARVAPIPGADLFLPEPLAPRGPPPAQDGAKEDGPEDEADK